MDSLSLSITASRQSSPSCSSGTPGSPSSVGSSSTGSWKSTNDDRCFHYAYSKPSPSSVILESSDSTSFYYPLNLLAELSSFFKHLVDLPADFHDEVDQPVYVLPSATTNGLRYVLDLITSLISGTSPPYLETAPFGEIFVIADAYDLPIVTSWIAKSSVSLLDKDPFATYTLGVMNGDKSIAEIAARRTLGRDISRMPIWASDLLKRMGPLHLIRLYEIHSCHSKAVEAMRYHMLYDQGIEKDMDDFLPLCKSGEGCDMYRMVGGDFDKLRRRLVDVVMDSIKSGNNGGMDVKPIKDIAGAMVWCPACRKRLEGVMMGAWRKTLGSLETTITL